LTSKSGLRKSEASKIKMMAVDVPARRFKRVFPLDQRKTSVASIADPAITRRVRLAAISTNAYPVEKLWTLGSHRVIRV
jgi:hypothetical protein